MKKSAGALGVAILGLGSSFFATPAMAADLADCGTAPAGGTLTLTGDVCLLTFSTPGTYNITTPKAFKSLVALVAGAGGGADAAITGMSWDAGYAGSGGKVAYVDLSDSAGEESAVITIGAGGLSSQVETPADGQASTFTIGSNTSTANGGAKGVFRNAPSYCGLPGTGDAIGVGDGAGGNSPSRAGENCVPGVGVNPSLSAADSAGTPASQLFASLNTELGVGGNVLVLPNALPAQTPGAGANVLISAGDAQVNPVADAAGANGFAAIAWQLPDSPEPVALADTGSDTYAPLLLGAGAMAIGAVMFSRAGRRRS